MADRIVIPFGPEILVLTEGEFEQARGRGRALREPQTAPAAAPTGSSDLVTAGAVAASLSLPKSCIYEYAKAGRIPVVRIGRHVRFDLAKVRAALGGLPVGRE